MPRHRPSARPRAAPAVGRPAPARRARAGDRPRPAGVPDGRAAVEPRRAAPRVQMRGEIKRLQQRPRRDHALRHPRPGRGDDDGRPRRGHAATGACSSSRTPDEIYDRPGQPVRRARSCGSPPMNVLDGELEPTAAPPSSARAGRRRAVRPARGRAGPSSSASGPSTSGSSRPARRTRCAARSTSSSRSATRRSSTFASASELRQRPRAGGAASEPSASAVACSPTRDHLHLFDARAESRASTEPPRPIRSGGAAMTRSEEIERRNEPTRSAAPRPASLGARRSAPRSAAPAGGGGDGRPRRGSSAATRAAAAAARRRRQDRDRDVPGQRDGAVPRHFIPQFDARDRDQGQVQRDQLRRLVPERQERRPEQDRRLRHLRHGRQLGAGVRRRRTSSRASTSSGLKVNPDILQKGLEQGYWPPKTGPRLKDFADATSPRSTRS